MWVGIGGRAFEAHIRNSYAVWAWRVLPAIASAFWFQMVIRYLGARSLSKSKLDIFSYSSIRRRRFAIGTYSIGISYSR